MKKFNLSSSWQKVLSKKINSKKYLSIINFIENEKKLGKKIYPEKESIFKALELTSFEETKVMIMGQDPYHREGEATGLSFSINSSCKTPPSLKNILKELKNDLKCENDINKDLLHWAEGGVLLLNSFLTVEKNKPLSHSNIGWEFITDEIIKVLNEKKKNIVFILWGKFAENKKKLIDEKKHKIIISSHPSPFSAKISFFGSKPFSKTNRYLIERNMKPIKWF